MDDSESESVASLSSRQSYSQSELSFDSGYKSNAEEGKELQKEKKFGNVRFLRDFKIVLR